MELYLVTRECKTWSTFTDLNIWVLYCKTSNCTFLLVFIFNFYGRRTGYICACIYIVRCASV